MCLTAFEHSHVHSEITTLLFVEQDVDVHSTTTPNRFILCTDSDRRLLCWQEARSSQLTSISRNTSLHFSLPTPSHRQWSHHDDIACIADWSEHDDPFVALMSPSTAQIYRRQHQLPSESEQTTSQPSARSSSSKQRSLRRIATGGYDGSICLWSLDSGAFLRRLVIPDDTSYIQRESAPMYDSITSPRIKPTTAKRTDRPIIHAMRFLPQCRTLIAACSDGCLRLWYIAPLSEWLYIESVKQQQSQLLSTRSTPQHQSAVPVSTANPTSDESFHDDTTSLLLTIPLSNKQCAFRSALQHIQNRGLANSGPPVVDSTNLLHLSPVNSYPNAQHTLSHSLYHQPSPNQCATMHETRHHSHSPTLMLCADQSGYVWVLDLTVITQKIVDGATRYRELLRHHLSLASHASGSLPTIGEHVALHVNDVRVLNRWRAHSTAITAIDIMDRTQTQQMHAPSTFVLTSAADCSMSVWSIDGDFVGPLGSNPHSREPSSSIVPLWDLLKPSTWRFTVRPLQDPKSADRITSPRFVPPLSGMHLLQRPPSTKFASRTERLHSTRDALTQRFLSNQPMLTRFPYLNSVVYPSAAFAFDDSKVDDPAAEERWRVQALQSLDMYRVPVSQLQLPPLIPLPPASTQSQPTATQPPKKRQQPVQKLQMVPFDEQLRFSRPHPPRTARRSSTFSLP